VLLFFRHALDAARLRRVGARLAYQIDHGASNSRAALIVRVFTPRVIAAMTPLCTVDFQA